MARKRTVIIGLDGVPYHLIQELSGNGTMPNVGMLITEGIFRQMESSIPEISSVAWSSIITGVNPGEHGIFGFTDLAPQTYRTTFPNFNSLKAPPFWRRDKATRSIIINVPSTYPARRLNGVLIAGFVALDLEKATYPPSLVPQLKSMDYRVDVDFQRANESVSFFLSDLNKTFQARISAYRYLWQNEDWTVFMLVFTGTDRLMHFLWNAYEDEAHAYHSAFLDHFHQIDEVIGEITQRMRDNDSIILLSDHGFERLDKDIYVNFVLKQDGMLKLENELPLSLKDIAEGTRAFALDPGRIYINLKDKYPRGCVGSQERESVLKELESIFGSLKLDSKRVIRRCYRKEEIYEGPFLPQAPDMVLLGNKGLNLRGSIKAKKLWEKGALAGKHSQPDAFLLVRGSFDRMIMPERPRVSDVVGIMNEL